LKDQYHYFDNQTIVDLLVRAPDRPQLVTRFRDRLTMLDTVTTVTFQRFIAQAMPVDRYIEIRTLPA
jgi:hypothetical protein